MPDFSKVLWIGLREKPGAPGPHLLIVYDDKWYLVPHVSGGWMQRERYIPTSAEAALMQAHIYDHEPLRDLWDTVTSGLTLDED